LSSVARYATAAVKTPAGRKAPAQPNQQYLNCVDYQPHPFQLSDIESACSTGFNKVSECLYIALNAAALGSALSTLDNLDEPRLGESETNVIDLGKTIRIGLAGSNNDIITFRLVKRTGNFASGGQPNQFPNVCYLVTGNKVTQTYSDALYPSVLGCASSTRSKQQFLQNGGYAPHLYTHAEVHSFFSSFLQVSGSLYLANSVSDLRTALSDMNSEGASSAFDSEVSLIDMGKTIRVGLVNGESDIFVFRLVKRIGVASSAGLPGDLNSYYVLVSNKLGLADDGNYSNVYVGVLGSSPTALQTKPQILNNADYRPYIFSLAQLQAAFASCTEVSGSLFLASSTTQFQSVYNVLNNTDNYTRISNEHVNGVDMGRTIRFGISGADSNMVTFALVKDTGNVTSGGEPNNYTDNPAGTVNDEPYAVPASGYVVVANKIATPGAGALDPRGGCTAPSDC
jgi:hypothetical protein